MDRDLTFAESPTELDLSTLTRAIDRGEREPCDYRLAYGLSAGADEYLARVDKLTDRLPRESPLFGRRAGDNWYWVVRTESWSTMSFVRCFSSKPNLYLQTIDQIRGSSSGEDVDGGELSREKGERGATTIAQNGIK